MYSHRNTELNRGLYQVCLRLNRESTEGKGEFCSWYCGASEDSKRASSFQEIAEKSQVSTCCGSPYRENASCIINNEVVLAAAEEAETGLFRIQWLCSAKANAILSQEYIRAWLSLQCLFKSIISKFIWNSFCLPIYYPSDVVCYVLATITGIICL